MDGPSRENKPLSAYGPDGKQSDSSLRRFNRSKKRHPNASGYDWIKSKRSTTREVILGWRGYFMGFYYALTKPRLPNGYYAFLKSFDLTRAEFVFFASLAIVLGIVVNNASTHILTHPPDIEIVTPAEAAYYRETPVIETKTDKE